jgi:uroporphyrinogen III methyltransferase/synthase
MTHQSEQPAIPRKPGRVVFVGAGPGDPALLTVRAVELLGRADVVVHDALVPREVLELCPPTAETRVVPRDGREGQADPGAVAGRMLVDLARSGRLVVRLKGGDPAVFGRLSEELGPVREAGLPLEIVPGVTAAAAAAAAAGITLTSRSAASSLTIVTGHEADDKREAIDFQTLANVPGTLAIYMGVEQVDRWSRELLAAGKSPETPVTIVSHCSWPDQRIGSSTLARCAADFARHAWPAPAVAIVGEVAQSGGSACLSPGPLAGRLVLTTRPAGQGDEIDSLVRDAGGSCLHVPAIRIGPPPSWEALDRAIDMSDGFDWIVFASVHGVRGFMDRLRQRGRDGRSLGTARLAAIGPATGHELSRHGYVCDLTPGVFRSEGIAAELGTAPRGSRFLLVRANRGRDLMRRELESRGHAVVEVAAYSTEPVTHLDPATATVLDQTRVHWLTVTSSFIAESSLRLFGERVREMRVASLSPVTSTTLRQLGVEPTVEADSARAASLITAMIDWEAAHGPAAAGRPAGEAER